MGGWVPEQEWEWESVQAQAREQGQPAAGRSFPMVVVDSLDISAEIGLLFEHVARVAAAIRGYSAFTRGHHGPEPAKARYDLLWLSDCLHTFDRVGRAGPGLAGHPRGPGDLAARPVVAREPAGDRR